MKQLFMWAAFTSNGKLITEFNPDGSENEYSKLPRQDITHFGLIQGQRSSYFIDLRTGVFHLKDHRLDKSLNIALPINGKQIPISGPGGFYPFHHFKEAHQDFNLAGQNIGGTIIDRYSLGWSAWKNLPGIGKRFVKTTMYIENKEAPKPVIQVELSLIPNTPAVDGSPYEFHA